MFLNFGKQIRVFDDEFSQVTIVSPKNPEVQKILINTHENIQGV